MGFVFGEVGRMSLILADDLVKSYGRVVAVDGLSLRVEEGSIMGLIGPNGSGKTTTIKIILGLLKPDRGSVRVFGEEPWDNPGIKSRVGIIYEKAHFPSHHKVLDYLERVCRIFGQPESRAREVLSLTGLWDAHDRNIKALSAGMLQKFAIAHALVNEPSLVVADEPTANLDPEARSSLLDLILKLHHAENVTFLISSHILPELSRICESVAIINQGRVWASGSLTELSEKLGAKTTRISTDNPEALGDLIRKLEYVNRVEVNGRGVSVGVLAGEDERLYEDVPKLAKEAKAKIGGIETGTASLEELSRLAVKSGQGEGHR
ncbi:MAG TPA: ABC transporter ATP-binding protein [Chloroflexi bacterium]|nr:ABC transporter ATP-binding protein [Chloroflexota bacterium]